MRSQAYHPVIQYVPFLYGVHGRVMSASTMLWCVITALNKNSAEKVYSKLWKCRLERTFCARFK